MNRNQLRPQTHLQRWPSFTFPLWLICWGVACNSCSRQSDRRSEDSESPAPHGLICFAYIGSSDHPIFPLIVTDSKLPNENLVRPLQPLVFWEHADIIRLSEFDFEKCASKLKGPLIESSPGKTPGFGVFRVTLMQGDLRISNALGKSQMTQFLGLIPGEVLRLAPPLQKGIDGLKTALKSFEAPE